MQSFQLLEHSARAHTIGTIRSHHIITQTYPNYDCQGYTKIGKSWGEAMEWLTCASKNAKMESSAHSIYKIHGLIAFTRNGIYIHCTLHSVNFSFNLE